MLPSLILTLVSSTVGASDVDGNTGQLLWVLSPSKVEMSPCQDVWLQTQTSSALISRQHGCEISIIQHGTEVRIFSTQNTSLCCLV